MIQKIKIFISIVLPVFLFLPIGSCDRSNFKFYITTSDSTQKSPEVQKEDSSKNIKKVKKVDYFVIAENISITSPTSWLPILLFLWPLPVLFIKNRFGFKSKWKKRGMNFLEFLFITSSTGYIFFFTFFFWYKPTKWGYLAAATITLYCIVFLVEIFSPFYNNKFGKKDFKESSVE